MTKRAIRMTDRRSFLALGSTLFAAALAGCGFHLRGSGPRANLPFKTLYLAVPAGSALGADLRRAIIDSGSTTVVTDPKGAEAVAEITSEARDRQILSLNSQGRVREYTLISRAAVQVRDSKGADLLPLTPIEVRRILNFNESQVLAKEQEEAGMYRDMQADLVQQILRRIAAIKPAALAPGPQSSQPQSAPSPSTQQPSTQQPSTAQPSSPGTTPPKQGQDAAPR
jgi:LPS-assembly lipoprotein